MLQEGVNLCILNYFLNNKFIIQILRTKKANTVFIRDLGKRNDEWLLSTGSAMEVNTQTPAGVLKFLLNLYLDKTLTGLPVGVWLSSWQVNSPKAESSSGLGGYN